MKTLCLLSLILGIFTSASFAATNEKQRQEIRHLLELKVPKSYILVLQGKRKIRDLLDGSELGQTEKSELKEFIDSPVPRNIIPLVRGDRNLDDLGLRDYYLSAVEEAKYKSKLTQN